MITTTETVMGVIILFFLMILMALLYYKTRYTFIMILVYLFSLLIGINALNDYSIPFSPYLQVLFLLFQSLLFLLTAIRKFKR